MPVQKQHGRALPCAHAVYGDTFFRNDIERLEARHEIVCHGCRPSSVCMRRSSSDRAHFATTIVATPLPIRLVRARAFRHKAIHPKQQRHARDRQSMHRGKGRRECHEPAARHGSSALGGQQQQPEDLELLSMAALFIAQAAHVTLSWGSLRSALGTDKVIPLEPMMGSEDFGGYSVGPL
jgi:hypothetical protein